MKRLEETDLQHSVIYSYFVARKKWIIWQKADWSRNADELTFRPLIKKKEKKSGVRTRTKQENSEVKT